MIQSQMIGLFEATHNRPYRPLVLAKWLIDRWVGGLLLLSGMHQNGLENGKQMQSCMHFWLSLKVVWLSLANLTTCDWIIRDLILHVNRTRHDPFFYFYFFILCVMIDCAALPKPVNMLNESQIIVWPTHILFTRFCLTFVYMSLAYWKTVRESLLFLIAVIAFFFRAKGPKHLNNFLTHTYKHGFVIINAVRN